MYISFNLDTIKEIAIKLLNNAGDKKVFAFHGEMGAGKTTFIHTLCEALKVIDVVSSPTFSIINEYNTIDGDIVYHLDLYRLKSNEEAINAGVEDCLYSGNTCLVEWPEKAPDLFPDNTLYITISVINESTRKIQW
ncbi:tRNA (adenosine(37)-N6)-threonylcarbamoyltransferase complex ATPase subunit type 1 TsaE [Ferruginibacter albus]|uniref:tRNA (adenosine(37)-N6)-threonylcarbamoyltransferase complex ATPase subunit type 1 TsaE n=1 Tax=Ferruginibacter albus TaxID=2875540 RepID=UPI001CC4D80A|nr:tRNA (adenosine(37)-N6)-threonylcarbamoyltransferase complex ATPase subunit type 1 TsaE [Ferruginibacter albus]UAY52430.1 tRNA (adenosine(37)-N6)-threonylcarbamoyltransferase complex ATPase subunit type 1 TsaE [Ferruginibacter albus]